MTEVVEVEGNVLDSSSSQVITIGKTKLRVKPAPVVGAHLNVRWEFRDDVEISDIMNVLPPEFQRRAVEKNPENPWGLGSISSLSKEEIEKHTEKLENGDRIDTSISKILFVDSDRAFSVKRSEGLEGYFYIKSSEWENHDPYIPSIEVRFNTKVTEDNPESESKFSRLFLNAEVTKDNIETIGKLEALRGKEMSATWCYNKKVTYDNTQCDPALCTRLS